MDKCETKKGGQNALFGQMKMLNGQARMPQVGTVYVWRCHAHVTVNLSQKLTIMMYY